MVRFIAGLGLLLLLALVALMLANAVVQRDWNGMLLGLGFGALLLFMGHLLWRGWQLARNPALAEVSGVQAGWMPLGRFFREVMVRTLEGRIVITGSVTCMLFGLLALAWPHLLSSRPGLLVLFFLWPAVLFTTYVKTCSRSNFRSGVANSATLLVWAALPFVWVIW